MNRYRYQCRVCGECNRPLDPDERCDCKSEPPKKEDNEKAAYVNVGDVTGKQLQVKYSS